MKAGPLGPTMALKQRKICHGNDDNDDVDDDDNDDDVIVDDDDGVVQSCSVLIHRCKTKSSFFIIGLITQRRKSVQNQILTRGKDRDTGRRRLKPNLWDSLYSRC